MKKKIPLIIIMFTLFTHAQQKGSYKICKDVVIYNIIFNKSLGKIYKKSYEKELVEMKFTLEKQLHGKLKCFLVKHNGDNIYNDKKPEDNKQEVDVSYFYWLIEKLNQIENESISYDWNVVDGITYSIEINGENYNVRLTDNWKDEKSAGFYDFFESVWNKYKE
jgi:hypothetical protein